MNKYYEMFINDNVDDSIINVNPNSLSYEDRFWHYVCLSCYYQKHNNKYMRKKSLSAACDLNYYYNAFIFYNAYGVLPKKYEKDMKKFEHPMILWDVDTLDWKYRNTPSIMKYIKKEVNDGSIILMHDIHKTSVDSLNTVLK